MRVNETALTEGFRIVSVQFACWEVAALFDESIARFRATQLTWWAPSPLTGMRIDDDGYEASGPPSNEQSIEPTPLGPALAVAVMYCVPAVESASVGPPSKRLTG